MYDLLNAIPPGIVAAAVLAIIAMKRWLVVDKNPRAAGLSALALVAVTYANAQQPKPPVLVGRDVGPRGTLFRETFQSMSLGLYQPTSSWRRGDNPFGCCTVEDSKPVQPGGGRYLRTYNVKSGTTNFRSEYWYVGTPYSNPRVNLVSVGSDQWKSPEAYWYGYMICADKAENTTGYGIYLNQFHNDDTGSGFDPNPMFALVGDANSLWGYIENSKEAPPITQFVNQSIVTPPLVTGWVGTCFPVIWQIFMDTRVSTAGSTGIIRLWIGDSPTPKWEWLNRQVGQRVAQGGNAYMPYFNIGGYQSLWKDNFGTNGDEWEMRYDNVTVMDSTGSWDAMMAALKKAN